MIKVIDYFLNGFDIVDYEGKFIYVNKVYSKMFGYNDFLEIIGIFLVKFCVDLIFLEWFVKNFKEKGKYICELKVRCKDGSEFDLLMYFCLDYDENGNEIYFIFLIDIIERCRMEEEKRKV